MKICDTHCHLTCDELYPMADELIARAKEHYVEHMLVICCTQVEYERALLLQSKYPEVIDIAYGFYPHQVNDFNEDDYIYLEEQIKQRKLCALGEIGLDYHWDDVSKEDQLVAFKRQMDLASKYEIPVVIHMRESTQDSLNVLKQYPKVKGILHCYSGSIEIAREAIKLGYLISFGGPLTFKNGRNILEVCDQLALENVVVETDSPYLTPHPYRGKRNEPMYVEVTFNKLCEVKNVDQEVCAKQLQLNYYNLFKVEY